MGTRDNQWEADFTINLDGERVLFDELTPEIKNHIIESIANGYECGSLE